MILSSYSTGTDWSSTQPSYHSVAGMTAIFSLTSSSNVTDHEPLGETKPLMLFDPLNDEVNDNQTC